MFGFSIVIAGVLLGSGWRTPDAARRIARRLAPEGLARIIFDGENVLLSKNGSTFSVISTGGSSGGSTVIFNVPLSGVVDGANRTFTVPFPFAQISVFLNGVKQIPSSDYVVTGASSIEMVTAPTGGAEADFLNCDLVLT